MNPKSWKIMVLESRNLENSLGNGIKIIEDNEKKTSIIQRRSICTNRFIGSGQIINRSDLICLRPAPKGSVIPYDINKIIGKKIKKNKNPGEAILWKDLK
ncbi:SAF domain-containing protein [Candidatus Pelagibacter sp. IMCC9063]